MAGEPTHWVTIGRIAGAFGIRGEVKVQPLTETPAGLPALKLAQWWLADPHGGAPRPIRVLGCRVHGEQVLARLDGITQREAAAALRGCNLLAPRELLPRAGEDEYYWLDLVGCAVVTEQGDPLGAVTELMATGANDVLVVAGPQGEERLLPFTQEVVLAVDLDLRRITVHLLPGL